jgi:hypothetical protein
MGLLSAEHDFVCFRTGQHNILLQFSANRRNAVVELRSQELAGTGLHLPDSRLKLRQAFPYRGLELSAGFLEISLTDGANRENRIILFHPDSIALGYEAYDLLAVWSNSVH